MERLNQLPDRCRMLDGKFAVGQNSARNQTHSSHHFKVKTNQRQSIDLVLDLRNGEGGIRTHGAREDTLVFKTRAINHSTTSPGGQRLSDQALSDFKSAEG